MLSFVVSSTHMVRCTPAANTFNKDFPWSHNRLFVRRTLVEHGARMILRALIVMNTPG